MTTRIRTLLGPLISGNQIRYGVPTPFSYYSSYKYSEDVADMPGVDHPVWLVSRTANFSGMNGGSVGTPGSAFYRYGNHAPPDGVNNLANATHVSLPALPSYAAMATMVRARTNPSRASVGIPVALAELRDIPRTLRMSKDSRLTGFASKENLRIQFGWMPLISDVCKLLSFASTVEKRSEMIRRMIANGGLRRKVNLYHDVVVEKDSDLFLNSGAAMVQHASSEKITTRNVWGTTRWVPSTYLAGMDDRDRANYIRRTVLGLTASQQFANAWNAVPWTWLIDWFANVGDLLEASNNSIAHTSGSACIMEHTHTRVVYTATTGGWMIPGSKSYVTLTEKRRTLSSSGFSASLPFLSGRQLSILGSLAILKFKGRR
ncbi:MAG: putative maturation protein [Tuwendivirus faecivivens]|uniref:Maturation protein n=1 Tax=Leviviridae sp. TaxID=2027243 RepID=A0ABY3STM8_9VIRU|nr:MAG: putative maturation protein [Leviviridae sp.]